MMPTRRSHLKSIASGVAAIWAGASTAHAEAAHPFDGIWSAIFEGISDDYGLRLIISGQSATLDFLDRGGSHKADHLVIEGDNIQAIFSWMNAKFIGKLTSPDRIDVTFTQVSEYPLSFYRGNSIPASATPIPVPSLSPAYLRQVRERKNTPALGVGFSDKSTSALYVTGLRSSKDTTEVRDTDKWHWGTITKSMTATLVARLVETGLIDWETPLSQVLPEANATPYRDTTLLHLLNHRSGLSLVLEQYLTYYHAPLPDPVPERLTYALEALKQSPFNLVGPQILYSHNGYVVAGAMLEKLTGRSWEDLMTAYVFEPLGMTEAGFGPPGHEGQLDQPLGHDATKPTHVPMLVNDPMNDFPVVLGPAGRVHMPIRDMLTYLVAHRDQPSSFLKHKSWQTLHTPLLGGSYAMGWTRHTNGNLLCTGSNGGWYAGVFIDRKSGRVCAAAGNDG
ncbi:MAG: serine hydrolase domain-containing protein, partial [Asticcacaulis sp.]